MSYPRDDSVISLCYHPTRPYAIQTKFHIQFVADIESDHRTEIDQRNYIFHCSLCRIIN